MYCPQCGCENTDEAKFCRSCGTPLTAAAVSAAAEQPAADATATDAGAAAPAEPAPDVTGVDATPAQPVGATEPAGDAAAQPSPVQPSAGYSYDAMYGSSQAAQPASAQPAPAQPGFGAKIAAMPTKQKAIIGGAAAVVVIAIIAIVMVVNSGPSDKMIEDYVRQTDLTSSMSESDTWSDAGKYEVKSVKVLSKTKDTSGTQSLNLLGNQLSDPYSAQVEVVFANDDTEVTKQGSMSIAKVNGQWQPLFFSSSDLKTSGVKLTKGVSEKKVKKNIDQILSQGAEQDKPSLTSIYSEGKAKIVKSDLDTAARTDKVTIELKSDADYYDAKGNIIATFSYGDSGWELKGAKAENKAFDVSYQKLVGSWTGEFDKQSSAYEECFGAKNNPVKVNITSVDEKTGKIEGTFSGLAHFHEKLSSAQDSCGGDTTLTDVPFTMVLDLSPNIYATTDEFEYQRDDDSEADFWLSFGSEGSKAQISSTYTGGDGFFSYASYTDYFKLTKDN